MYAREVRKRGARGGYRFEILGDFETDARDLFELLRERIRQGLSVRHVEKTEHGWQLTPAHRLNGVIEWDPETKGALPLLNVDGRTFSWDQIGRMMMTFEGFTLNAVVEDTIEVVGGPLAEGRLDIQASHQPAAAVPAAVVRRGASNRRAQTAEANPLMAPEPAPARRLDRGGDGGCLRRIRAGNGFPDRARGAADAAIWCDRPWRDRGRREDRFSAARMNWSPFVDAAGSVRRCDSWIWNCPSPGRRAPSGSPRTTAGRDGDRRVSDRDSTN